MTIHADLPHRQPPESAPEERKISTCTCGTEFAYGPEKENTYVTCFSCGEKVALNKELNAVDREMWEYRQEDKERADMGCGLCIALEIFGVIVLVLSGSVWLAICVNVAITLIIIACCSSRSVVPAELERKQRVLRATMRN